MKSSQNFLVKFSIWISCIFTWRLKLPNQINILDLEILKGVTIIFNF